MSLHSCHRLKDLPVESLIGVWTADQKLAVIGIRVSHLIIHHDTAPDVTTYLTPFGRIVPCGIRDRPVGNIKGLVRALLSSDEFETFETYHLVIINWLI